MRCRLGNVVDHSYIGNGLLYLALLFKTTHCFNTNILRAFGLSNCNVACVCNVCVAVQCLMYVLICCNVSYAWNCCIFSLNTNYTILYYIIYIMLYYYNTIKYNVIYECIFILFRIYILCSFYKLGFLFYRFITCNLWINNCMENQTKEIKNHKEL